MMFTTSTVLYWRHPSTGRGYGAAKESEVVSGSASGGGSAVNLQMRDSHFNGRS
jgi:hypothetical protein